jgi:23S rRNA G2445 N2-methylase RlmL
MDKLIETFSIKSVNDFFKNKISSFSPNRENLDYILKDTDFTHFSDLQKIGEVEFNNSDELIVFTCKFQGILSERSSKKRQFEIAKKVLKEDFKDGAIFIFYDENDCFRFSFIRKNYGNKDQKFTNWKRYTYFVDPARTNKTFKNRINGCNFSSLEDIQEAFSVEKLNKKFYEDIATAFYSLIGGKVSINKKEVSFDAKLQLPSTPVENRKGYQEFAVRLIGRTIFCWFLKNKKSDSGVPLIPEDWLSSNMVTSVNNDKHNYYHSILEKLFFLVLNKKQEDRKPYVLPNNHEIVPFLNGGLFEAQDDDFFPKDNHGIHSENKILNIPNQWFKDFFETLEQYNFTIDENSINDFEVSIDPEMLGTIFENLLAEIDPDTEKSARKSTGSFYTPREIVDYMVEQSLLQYIKTKTNIEDEEQLEVLLKDDSENPFNEKETIVILQALSEVKILDPACGSGAFPMGVLHKIIGLLKKLDKNAVWWKAKQLEKIDNALVRKTMETKLNQANSDYIRKLGVIQHSIYGVDIQPIAAEISKLRSFLSLIIDENIDDNHPDGNRGIEPLPNLEFKFVTANTLISLDEGNTIGKSMTFDFGETSELQNQLQKIRSAYLQATPTDKQQLKTDFEKLQTQIYKNELKAGGQNKRAQQLAAWKPFSNDSSTWFDPDWMFGVEKFDVVIGNPPYGSIIKDNKEYFNSHYKCTEGKHEIYKYFIERGLYFLKENGTNSYIVPDTWTGLGYFKKLRKLIFEKYNLISISKTLYKVFEMAMVDTNIFFIQNSKNKTNDYYLVSGDLINKEIKLLELNEEFVLNIKDNNNVVRKVDSVSTTLNNFSEIWQGLIAYGKKNQPRSFTSENKETEFHRKLLYGKNVSKYYIEWGGEYLKYGDWLHRPRPSYIFDNEKILVQRIRNPQLKQRLVCAFDDEKYINGTGMSNILLKKGEKDVSLKYILAIINSKLINYWFAYYFNDVNIKPEQLRKIPIIKCNSFLQKKFENSINEIDLALEDNLCTKEIETKIDIMVYKLYELTYEEILVVDPEFSMSKQEYDNFKA